MILAANSGITRLVRRTLHDKLTCHVDYTTAKRLGQEMTAPVHRGLYLVTVTRQQWQSMRSYEPAREYNAY